MKKKHKMFLYLSIGFAILILLFYCMKIKFIGEIVYLIVLSFIISYSIKPIYLKLISFGINKRIVGLCLLLSMGLAVLVVFVLLIPSIFKESLNINHAANEFQTYIDTFTEKVKPINNNKIVYVVLEQLYERGNKALIDTLTKIFDSALHFGQNILAFAVMPIIIYYFLVDGEKISNRLVLFLPIRGRLLAKKIGKDIDKILGRYIISQFLLCILVGVCTFIILVLLKVEFPIILSILNAAFNIIPYFGPLFGALPAIAMAALHSSKSAIWVALWLYLIQQIEGNLISPKITGDSVSMHPLLIIILLIIGGKIGGFLGMVLAVPIGVALKVIYEDVNYHIF